MTRFSIIIPCYNAAATLTDTLASLRAQTFSAWEAICVDDGSSDTTAAQLDAAAATDPRIRRVPNCGKGPSAARNTAALDHAKGEIIAFLDADDLWVPKKLALLDEAFRNPTVTAAYGQIGFFEQTPADSRTRSTVPVQDLTVPMVLGENPVCTLSNLAVRSEDFRHTQGFDQQIVHNEDLEWLIRLLATRARVVGLPELHVWYRTTPTGLSADLAAMRRGRRAALATATAFGFAPEPRHEAIHLRYLARRALRLQLGRATAARLALSGMLTSPAGFFDDRRRGALTASAALLSLILPRRLSARLFAH